MPKLLLVCLGTPGMPTQNPSQKNVKAAKYTKAVAVFMEQFQQKWLLMCQLCL
jgi:hypothetical protein